MSEMMMMGGGRKLDIVSPDQPNKFVKRTGDSMLGGLQFAQKTTAERDAIDNPAEGTVIFNTTTSELNVYKSGAWTVVGDSDAETTYLKLDASNDPITGELQIGNDTTLNHGINTAPSASYGLSLSSTTDGTDALQGAQLVSITKTGDLTSGSDTITGMLSTTVNSGDVSAGNQNNWGFNSVVFNSGDVSGGTVRSGGGIIQSSFSGVITGSPTATVYGLDITAQGNMGTLGTTEHRGLSVVASGTADTNYGIYLDSSGATTNYSMYSADGDVALAGDGMKLYFGSGLDIYHEFDGTDFKTVGTGDWDLTGFTNFTTNSNVGIGVTSPNEDLEIGGSGRVFIGDGGGGSRTGLLIDGSEGGTRVRFDAYDYGGSQNIDLVMQTFGGDVGIGTTSPAYKLDISGGGIQLDGKSALTNSAYFVGSPSFGFRWNNNADTLNNVIMYDNGNMYVRGAVGIGTTSPQTDLEVVDSTSRTSFTGTGAGTLLLRQTNGNTHYTTLDFQGSGSTAGIAQSRIASEQTGSGSYLHFGTSNSYVGGITNTAMTIRYDARVGIGTTSPETVFHVEGGTGGWAIFERNNNQLYVNGDYAGAGNYGFLGMRGSDSMGLSLSSNDNNPEYLFIDSAGDVGVGTVTPQCQFQTIVASETSTTDWRSSTNKVEIKSAGSTGAYSILSFSNTGGNDQMFIGSVLNANNDMDMGIYKQFGGSNLEQLVQIDGVTGNVGIGESSPNSTLHVGGSVAKNIQRNTTTATIDDTAYAWFGNTDSAGFTYTLPAGVQDREYRIVNTGTSGNQLTIAPNGAEHLLGVNSSFALNDGESLIIAYDATDGWY